MGGISEQFNPVLNGGAAIINEGCKKEKCLRTEGTNSRFSLARLNGVELSTLCAGDWAKCTNGVTMGVWFKHQISAAWADLFAFGNAFRVTPICL